MAPAYPTLRERVRCVLLDAGFKDREDTLPTYATRGTFTLTSGAGVAVAVSWWDSAPDQRRALLESFAGVLEGAGFVVERREGALYVAVPEERSDEE